MTTSGQIDIPSTTSTAKAAFPLHKRVLTALAAVSILGAAGCAGAETEAPTAEAPAAEASASDTAEAAPATGDAGGSAAVGDQTYEDGTYTETGSYQSPGGTESIGVTFTLEADVVTAVETEPMPTNPTATMYQERFVSGISDAVVGKKLDELEVDKVAGSSLTSGGFNDATDKIKSDAQV